MKGVCLLDFAAICWNNPENNWGGAHMAYFTSTRSFFYYSLINLDLPKFIWNVLHLVLNVHMHIDSYIHIHIPIHVDVLHIPTNLPNTYMYVDYIYLYIYIYIYIYVCVCVCVFIILYLSMSVSSYIFISMSVSSYPSQSMSINSYLSSYLSIYLSMPVPSHLSTNPNLFRGNPRDVVANVPDWDIIVSEFELQSSYYVHFWINTLGKDMNPLIPLSIG